MMAHHSSSLSPASVFVGGGSGGVVVRAVVVFMAISLVGYVVGLHLLHRFVDGFAPAVDHGSSCPLCVCNDDCSSNPLGLSPLFECGGGLDASATTETEERFTDLLLEELKLQEIVALDKKRQSARSIREARKISSHYQKEAQKCNIGMETCEGARQRAEASHLTEKKLTSLWESRARELGWTEDDNDL